MRITFEKADDFNEQLTNREVRQLIKTYKLSLLDVENLIKELKKEYSDTWFLMSKYKRLKAISKEIKSIVNDLTKKTNVIIEKGEIDSYIASYKITDKTFDTIVGISLTQLDENAIKKAIKNPFLKVSSIERNTNNIKELQKDLTQNLIFGDSYKSTAKKVSNTFKIATNKSERIVRTENHRIQIDSRLDGIKNAQSLGLVIKKEWVSALDERTRGSHRSLNGTVITVDEYFRSSSGGYGKAPGSMGTGADDINCRCSLASIIY